MKIFGGIMKIGVIGLGGCGFNNISFLSTRLKSEHVELICLSTEAIKPNYDENITFIQLGEKVTNGLGAGANVEVGKAAFLASKNTVTEVIKDLDVAIVTTGFGGGTGTGGITSLLTLLCELKILHFTIATLPFPFEGNKKAKLAREKAEEVLSLKSPLLLLENSKLLSKLDKKTKLIEAFDTANISLANITSAIIGMIENVGLINIDLADLRLVLSQPGLALVGQEQHTEENNIEKIISSASLLNTDLDIQTGSAAILIISAPESMLLEEYDRIGNDFRNSLSSNATIISGLNYTKKDGENIDVFILVTGLKPTSSFV